MIGKGIFIFKPATIHKLKNGSWVISFKCKDVTGRLKEVRKTCGINKIKNIRERKIVATEICALLNKALSMGWNYFSDPDVITEQKQMPIKKALEISLEYKKTILKESSYRSYQSTAKLFINFIGLHTDVNEIKKRDFYDFVSARKKAGIQSKTINKNIELLRSLLKHLVRIEIIKSNPLDDFEHLKERKKVGFKSMNEKEVSEIFELLKIDKHYRLFCCCIFYAGIRPTHLTKMQRWQIDFENNYIYTSADNNKNCSDGKKQLLLPLKNEMIKHKINELQPNKYLFGKNFKPDDLVAKSLTTRSRERWNKYIQIPLSTDKKQYALKHSFAQIMDKRNVNLRWLQQHFEHGTMEQTETYLRNGKTIMIEQNDQSIPNVLGS